MSKTASQINQGAHEENRLNREIHQFFERWTPKDPREASEFQMHFHSVTRAIYGDMQKPVTECLKHVLMTRPVTPVIIDKDIRTRTDL